MWVNFPGKCAALALNRLPFCCCFAVSLPADKSAANTAQRVHITLELAWSADATVQQLGRTHRSAGAVGAVRAVVCCCELRVMCLEAAVWDVCEAGKGGRA